ESKSMSKTKHCDRKEQGARSRMSQGFRVDANGDVEMTTVQPFFEFIKAPRLSRWDQPSLIKWHRERHQYETKMQERCDATGKSYANVVQSVKSTTEPWSVKSTTEPWVLQNLCKWHLAPDILKSDVTRLKEIAPEIIRNDIELYKLVLQRAKIQQHFI
ncbi:TPA: hypothetical protein N0F65_005239, partial [Lagenidium giganteum]